MFVDHVPLLYEVTLELGLDRVVVLALRFGEVERSQ